MYKSLRESSKCLTERHDPWRLQRRWRLRLQEEDEDHQDPQRSRFPLADWGRRGHHSYQVQRPHLWQVRWRNINWPTFHLLPDPTTANGVQMYFCTTSSTTNGFRSSTLTCSWQTASNCWGIVRCDKTHTQCRQADTILKMWGCEG